LQQEQTKLKGGVGPEVGAAGGEGRREEMKGGGSPRGVK